MSLRIHLARSEQSTGIVAPVGQGVSVTDPVQSSIQHCWSSFDRMTDAHRVILLKGVLERCSEKEINFICSSLNLHFSDITPLPVVQSEEAHRKLRVLSLKRPPTSPNKTFSPDDDRRPIVRDIAHAPILPKLQKARDQDRGYIAVSYGGMPLNRIRLEEKNRAPTMVNSNLYMRLVNDQYNYDRMSDQFKNASVSELSKCIQFLTQRCQRFEAVFSVVRQLASPATRSFSILFDSVRTALSADFITVYRYDQQLDQCTVVSSTWQETGRIVQLVNVMRSNFVFKTGKTVNMFAVTQSEDYTDEIEDMYGELGGFECLLSVPIRDHVDEHICGILEVVNKRASEKYFSPEDEQTADQFAAVCGYLLHQEFMKKEMRLHQDRFDEVTKIVDSWRNSNDTREVLQNTQEAINATSWCLFEAHDLSMDPNKSYTKLSSKYELKAAQWSGEAPPLAGHVRSLSNALALHLKNSARVDPDSNAIFVPIVDESGQALGAIEFSHKRTQTGRFDKYDRKITRVLAALLLAQWSKHMVENEVSALQNKFDALSQYSRTVMDACSDIIVTLDRYGRLVSLNGQKRLGLTDTFVAGMREASYTRWLDSRPLIDAIQHCLPGAEPIMLKGPINVHLEGRLWRVKGCAFALPNTIRSFMPDYNVLCLQAMEATDTRSRQLHREVLDNARGSITSIDGSKISESDSFMDQ